MSKQLTPEEQRAATELLSNRLRTLLDVVEADRGTEVTFTEVSQYLTARGVSLSRPRWWYLVNGRRYVDDLVLLDALSDFFDVPHGFLRGTEEAPEKVTAQLDLVRAMRVAKVRTYAARTLGDLSPETLKAVTKYLDNEATRAGGAPRE